MLVKDRFSFFSFSVIPVTIAKLEKLRENSLLKWNELAT